MPSTPFGIDRPGGRSCPFPKGLIGHSREYGAGCRPPSYPTTQRSLKRCSASSACSQQPSQPPFSPSRPPAPARPARSRPTTSPGASRSTRPPSPVSTRSSTTQSPSPRRWRRPSAARTSMQDKASLNDPGGRRISAAPFLLAPCGRSGPGRGGVMSGRHGAATVMQNPAGEVTFRPPVPS